MSLLSDDQQRLLHDSIDKYFADNCSFESRQKLVATELGYSPERWARFAEFGWLAIPFPEEFGGLGGSVFDVAHLVRAMGQTLALEPLMATVLAGQLVARGSNDTQKDSVLAEIIAGQSTAAIAYQERASNGNPACVNVTAEAEGDSFRIRGEKIAVTNASQARYVVVSARISGDQLDSGGIALFVIDTESVDLALTPYATVDSHRAANIQFDTLLSRDCLFADSESGYALLSNVIQEGILMSCIEAIGAMKALLDTTVLYTSQRKQFGVPLATFQVLKHRLADMYIAYQSSESLLEEVVAGNTVTLEDASILKAHVGKTSRMIGDAAIQLHGGMGMTDELSVGHYAKRLIALNALFGNVDFHLKQIWQRRN